MKRRFYKSYSEENPIVSAIGFIPMLFLLLVLFGFINTEKGKPFFHRKLIVDLPQSDFQEMFSDDKPVIYFSIGKSNYRPYSSHFYGIGMPRLSINDKIASVNDIPFALSLEPYYSSFGEEIRAVLRVDKNITMSSVQEVTETLQLYNHVEILYATTHRFNLKTKNINELLPPDLEIVPPRTAQPPLDSSILYPNFFK